MALIDAIYNCHGQHAFNTALQVLFDNGLQKFTADFVACEKEKINLETPTNSILSASFKCGLLDIALELSQFKFYDILLYIKLYVWIKGDDLIKRKEVEHALSSYFISALPDEYRKAVEDPEIREEIILLMVKNHQQDYTNNEASAAIRQATEMGSRVAAAFKRGVMRDYEKAKKGHNSDQKAELRRLV